MLQPPKSFQALAPSTAALKAANPQVSQMQQLASAVSSGLKPEVATEKDKEEKQLSREVDH